MEGGRVSPAVGVPRSQMGELAGMLPEGQGEWTGAATYLGGGARGPTHLQSRGEEGGELSSPDTLDARLEAMWSAAS